MLALIRAEMRKLFSIRSTYVLSAVALLFAGFVAASFWLFDDRSQALNPVIIMDAIYKATMVSAVFVAVIAVLLVTHEYRYNTITYTLTASNSRSKVLVAKLAVIVAFSTLFTILVTLVAAGLAWMGIHFAYDEVVRQHFYVWDIMWRSVFYVVGYVLVGTIFAFAFRHVVGAIVSFLLLPTTVEALLALWLKENTKYLPFATLEQVHSGVVFSPGRAALIFTGYIVVGLLTIWWLFTKRDAN